MWQRDGSAGEDCPERVPRRHYRLDGPVVKCDEADRRRHGFKKPSKPIPDPDALFPCHLRATMTDLSEQIRSCLAVQLTRAEKDALNLLAAWPLCNTEQFMGLMGGVTRRRANQVIQSQTSRSLIRTREQRHFLTDEGLCYLAHRDRAAVKMALGCWSALLRRTRNSDTPVYRGIALRTMASQLHRQDAITGFGAAMSAETARSQDYELLELLPTSRSSIGYHYHGADYVVHPDATFLLCYRVHCRPYFLEFERRAITPKRVRARLKNYRRYFASGWPGRDHGGQLPLVLFLFEFPRPRRPS